MNDREKLAAVTAIASASPTEMNKHLEVMLETYADSDDSSLNVEDTSNFTGEELDDMYIELRSDIDTIEETTE